MKNIFKLFMLLLFALASNAQPEVNNTDKNVVQNVVLINSLPWEVLMNKDGDILAKLKYLPDYFKGYDVNWVNDTNYDPNIHIVKETVRKVGNLKNSLNDDKIFEIYFHIGSALLKDKQIQELNNLAQVLNSNHLLKVRLYGFSHEPETRAMILGKRRMDAVIAYLRIKGVDIEKQIIKGNIVNGQNNKIVFAFD